MTSGRQVPLAQQADIDTASASSSIRNGKRLLIDHAIVDLEGRDSSSCIAVADTLLRRNVDLPPGFAIAWSGQYEAMARVRERLELVIFITLFPIILMRYLNTRFTVKTFITLLGVVAKTGVFMLPHPGLACKKAKKNRFLRNW